MSSSRTINREKCIFYDIMVIIHSLPIVLIYEYSIPYSLKILYFMDGRMAWCSFVFVQLLKEIWMKPKEKKLQENP